MTYDEQAARIAAALETGEWLIPGHSPDPDLEALIASVLVAIAAEQADAEPQWSPV